MAMDKSRGAAAGKTMDKKAALEDAFGRDIDLLPDVDVQPGSKVASEITKYGVMVYAGQ